jgi:hypothetical protein
VRTTCTGAVALQEVLGHFDELQRDPARPSPCDVLLRLVALESPPRLPDVSAVADRIGWRPGFQIRRCAIVADSDLAFGIGRMFATMARRHFGAVSVFHDAGEADRWLLAATLPED